MDLNRLDLRLLFTLEAIHRLGSLTAAGAEVGLSQPALSHALARLRDVCGDPLFVRTSRGMRPTPRADQLAAGARRIKAAVRSEFVGTGAFNPAEMRRAFTFAMSDIGEMVFLPGLLARLRRDAPDCDVTTASLPPDRLGEALENGTVDLALGFFPDLAGASLEQQPLFERGYCCLASDRHPRLGERLSLDEFLAEPHLVVASAGRVEELFESHLRREKLARRVLVSVPHMFALPWILPGSDLIATVPETVGARLATGHGLRPYPPPLSAPRILVSQHWSARYANEPAMKWLRNVVADLFADRASS